MADKKDMMEAKDVDISKEDEMLPKGAQPVSQGGGSSSSGEERDTAGQHGRMAVESAKGLEGSGSKRS